MCTCCVTRSLYLHTCPSCVRLLLGFVSPCLCLCACSLRNSGSRIGIAQWCYALCCTSRAVFGDFWAIPAPCPNFGAFGGWRGGIPMSVPPTRTARGQGASSVTCLLSGSLAWRPSAGVGAAHSKSYHDCAHPESVFNFWPDSSQCVDSLVPCDSRASVSLT